MTSDGSQWSQHIWSTSVNLWHRFYRALLRNVMCMMTPGFKGHHAVHCVICMTACLNIKRADISVWGRVFPFVHIFLFCFLHAFMLQVNSSIPIRLYNMNIALFYPQVQQKYFRRFTHSLTRSLAHRASYSGCGRSSTCSYGLV